MVSTPLLGAALAAALAAGSLLGQSTPPVIDTTKPAGIAEQQGNLATPPPEPSADLTPERRGDILMARKDFRTAIESYKKAGLDSPIIWNKIGIAYHQMMQLDTAKKHYERAIKLNPKYSEAINNLGTIHYAKKNFRRAASQYKKALKLAPQSASIYSNLGTAYFARKKYNDAFDAYQKALALDPEVFEHRSSYGVLLQERGVEERAKFHYYLAKTYAKAGINDRALLYLRKALEEGFKDKQKLTEDPEFTALKDLPEFQELLKLEPRVL
jgi:tetratricopeptide (TPR) repeat protein